MPKPKNISIKRKGVTIGTRLDCVDNSGAKVAQIIGVLGKNNTAGRMRCARIGDMVVVAIKKGAPGMKGTVQYAVVVNTVAKFFRRSEGLHVGFKINAAVILNSEKVCKITTIKVPIPKEVLQCVPSLSGKGAPIV